MLAADTLLTSVQAIVPAVTGLTLPDLGDPSTWIIHGLITPAEGLRAIGLIRTQLAGPAAVSASFWPAPATPLERDVAQIKAVLGLSS